MTTDLELKPDPEGAPRRRPWLAGLAAAMLVAAAGGAGFGLGYAVGNDGDRVADPAASTDEPGTTDAPTPVTTEADTIPPAAVPDTEPDAEPEAPVETDAHGDGAETFEQPIPIDDVTAWYGPDPWAAYELVYERTTGSGLTVRAQAGERWAPVEERVIDGWSMPGWCHPAGLLRLSFNGPGVVDVTHAERYDEVYDLGTSALRIIGSADGAPHRVVVLSLAGGVDSATVTFDDGATDSAIPVDGLAVLAVPGFGSPGPRLEEDYPYPMYEAQGYTVELSTGGATITRRNDELGSWENPMVRASCQPPPPALPPAGEQPADPAAAEDEIRSAMAQLYGGDGDAESNAEVIDDPTGVADAREQVRQGGFETEAASAEAIIEELVFTTSTEAWFRYRIETGGLDLDGRYGMAVVVDGTWRITRDTICQDLSLAGGDCGNWQPIQLPTG